MSGEKSVDIQKAIEVLNRVTWMNTGVKWRVTQEGGGVETIRKLWKPGAAIIALKETLGRNFEIVNDNDQLKIYNITEFHIKKLESLSEHKCKQISAAFRPLMVHVPVPA